MSNCLVCIEKDKMIEAEKVRIEDILEGYKSDKITLRKTIKYLLIAIGVLVVELILTLAYGNDGVLIGLELIKGFFK